MNNTLLTPLRRFQRRPRALAAAAAVALVATSVIVATAPVQAADAPTTVTQSVYFDSGKSFLTDTAKATLDLFLLEVPIGATDVSANVQGWVQRTPNRENDRRLSTARAKVVSDYLQEQGYSGSISYVGRGVKDRTASARRATVTITYSAPVVVEPPAPGPTVPCRIPSAALAVAGSVTRVDFVLGCDGGSPITSVQYERDGVWVTVSPTSPFTINDPVTNIPRIFPIRAVNAVGPGPVTYVESPSISCTPAEYIEGAGTDVWWNGEGYDYEVWPGYWTGDPTFTYEWYWGYAPDGDLIAGATSDAYSTGSYDPIFVRVIAHSGGCTNSIDMQLENIS